MSDSMAARAGGRARPSRSRTQAAWRGIATRAAEDEELRRAGRVIRVRGVVGSLIEADTERMQRMGRKRRARIAQLAAIAAAVAIAGCAGDGDTSTSAPATAAGTPTREGTSTGQATTSSRPHDDRHQDNRGHGGGDVQEARFAGEARTAVGDYIAAIDDRDGAALCAAVAPGALEGVELPVNRGSCARSVTGSIGYADPRGRFPVWRSSEVRRFRTIHATATQARVTVTVRTLYADNREPSIEDDVVFLTRADGGWLIAKPSVTFYRAIGVADVPPQVLAAP